MPVPKKHGTSGKRDRRRSSHKRPTRALFSKCAHCSKPTLPHTVCKNCGYYKNQEVLDVVARDLKKQEKQKQRRTGN